MLHECILYTSAQQTRKWKHCKSFVHKCAKSDCGFDAFAASPHALCYWWSIQTVREAPVTAYMNTYIPIAIPTYRNTVNVGIYVYMCNNILTSYANVLNLLFPLLLLSLQLPPLQQTKYFFTNFSYEKL